MSDSPLVPTAIFVSGTGTNLQAVIDAVRDRALPLDVKLVVSSKPGVLALERASRAGIPAAVFVWNRGQESRGDYAARLASAVRAAGARLVLLLGWMHVLAPEFLSAGFDGVLNLHPAYLPDDPAAEEVTLPDGTTIPAFRGAHALRDAIAARMRFSGATLIEITADVDRGPVLARATLALEPGEDEEAALERLHGVEREVVKDGIWEWLRRRSIGSMPASGRRGS